MPKFIIPRKQSDSGAEGKSPVPSKRIMRPSDATYQRPYSALGDPTTKPVRANSNYVIHASKKPVFNEKTLAEINRDTSEFRIKNTHSNEWTNLEIIAAKYAGLTGIAVPWTIFAEGVEKDNPNLAKDCQNRKDINTKPEYIPNYFVASERLRGYQDLSTFLDYVYNNQLDFFFHLTDNQSITKRQEFLRNYDLLTEIKQLPNSNHALIKPLKRNCMVECFKLLPENIRDMIDEVYVVSAWLGNWDMFNWDLTNTGFTVKHKENGSVEIFPAIIDFGNCLYAGFSGKYKHESLESANSPAKIKEKTPDDFDPPISQDKQIKIQAAVFSAIPGLALATIPRRLPFEDLFKHNDKKVIECIENKRSNDGSLSKGFLRGLFRISLIEDHAIDEIGNSWFYLGKGLNYKDSAKSAPYSAESLSQLMKDRRDYICKVFEPEIKLYETLHREEASETRREVTLASLDATKDALTSKAMSA